MSLRDTPYKKHISYRVHPIMGQIVSRITDRTQNES